MNQHSKMTAQGVNLAAFVRHARKWIWLGRGFTPAFLASPTRCRGYGRGLVAGIMSQEQRNRTNIPHTSIDEHVIPTQLEEARDILEHEREAVVLPVIGIIGEFDCSLDI